MQKAIKVTGRRLPSNFLAGKKRSTLYLHRNVIAIKKISGLFCRLSLACLTVLLTCMIQPRFATAIGPSTRPVTQPTSLPTTKPTSRPTSRHIAASQPLPTPPKATFELAESATNAETASITLRGISNITHGDSSLTRITEDLPDLTSEIDARLDETNKLLASSPSLQLLGSQEEAWDAIRQNLDEWNTELQRRFDLIQRQFAFLDGDPDKGEKGLTKIWEEEENLLDFWAPRAKRQDIVETARDTIEKTLTQITSTEDDLKQARINIVALQQQVNVQTARVLDVLESVRESRDQAFSRLLVRNSAPLWSPSLYARDQGGLVQQGSDSFTRQAQGTAAYIRQRWENIGAHVAILLALIIGLFMVRRKIGVWTEHDPALEQHTRIFCSPIPTALALSLLIAIWIYPEAPRLFWAAIGAAALVPTVIILRKLIDVLLFPVLNALVAFYFLDQVRGIAAVVPIAARVVLLAEMVGAAILLISFIRSTRNLQTSIWKLIRAVSWLWTTVFVVAAISDILGFVSLANLLGDAALGGAYLAVILYAGAVIVSGLTLIALRCRPVNLLKMVRDNQGLVLHRSTRFIYFLAFVAWIVGVLASLSVLSSAYELVQKVLLAQLNYGALHLSLGQVLEFIFTVWLSFQISRFLRFVLEEDVYDRLSLPSGIPYAISKLLHYVVLLIGFYIALSTLNKNDLSTLNVLAGAFGVGLAFGTQNIVNNFVSGLILLFERPVKVGDVIQMGDTNGTVVHIGIRASIIRTMDSSEIIVPNGMLISSTVTNWTLSNRQRGVQLQMALGSNSDPKHVIEVLKRVASENPLVTKIPAPQVFLTKFAADSFSYEMHVWTNYADRWIEIRSDLSVALNAALVKENISIK